MDAECLGQQEREGDRGHHAAGGQPGHSTLVRGAQPHAPQALGGEQASRQQSVLGEEHLAEPGMGEQQEGQQADHQQRQQQHPGVTRATAHGLGHSGELGAVGPDQTQDREADPHPDCGGAMWSQVVAEEAGDRHLDDGPRRLQAELV